MSLELNNPADNASGLPEQQTGNENFVPPENTNTPAMQVQEEKISILENENSMLNLMNQKLFSDNTILNQHIEKYRELYDHAPVGYISSNDKGIILDVNKPCSKMFALETEQMLGRSIKDFMADLNSIKTFESFWYDTIKNAKTSSCELELKRGNDSRFSARIRGLALKYDSISSQEIHCNLTISDITESKITEIKLRQSEELFRNLFENTPDAIFLIDIESGKIIDANSTASKLLQKEKYLITGLHYSSLFPKHEKEASKRLLKFYTETLKSAKNILSEFHVLRGDNMEVPVEITASPINFQNQNLLMTVFRNVSDKTKAMHLSRIQYELITALSSTSDLEYSINKLLECCLKIETIDTAGIYFIDEPSGGIHLASVKGLSEKYIQKVKYFNKTSPIGIFSRQGIPLYGRFDEFAKSFLDVNVSEVDNIQCIAIIPIRSGNDVVALLCLSSKYIDEIPSQSKTAIETIAASIGSVLKRIKVENELKESEERFRTVADFTHDWEYWISPEGRFLYVSPSCKRITGYSPDDIMQDSSVLKNIVAPEHWPEFYRRIYSHDLSEDSSEFEYKILTRTNEKKWLSHVSSPVYNKDNSYLGRRGSSRDITEKKKVEEVLKEARKMAEEVTRTKGEFLANMSHEIRTPLNAIIGFATLMLESKLSEEEKAKSLTTIKNQSEDLLVLINDILDLSKIEAGKLELSYVSTNLKELIEKCMSVVFLKAKSKALDLAWDIDNAAPETILTDPFRLKQILLNIIGNAIKFTEKGRVSLHVKRANESELPFSVYSNDSSPLQWLSQNYTLLLFEIKDTGIGIPKEKQNLLFKAFSQIDGSTSRKYGGTGLGLKISSSLVEMMNGSIWVDSAIGEGSSFYFTIRVPLDNSAAAPVHTRKAIQAASPLRIIIADDELTSITLLKKLLEKEGHSVTTLNNGRQLLTMLETEVFDAVLMDIKMPDVNGIEAIRIIRKKERNSGKRLPIIATTVFSQQFDKKLCIDAGADEFLPKPIMMKDLLKVLSKLTS